MGTKVIGGIDPKLSKQIKAIIGAMSSKEINELMDSITGIHATDISVDGDFVDVDFDYSEVEDELSEDEKVEPVFKEYVLQQLLSSATFTAAYEYATGPKWAVEGDTIKEVAQGVVSYFDAKGEFVKSQVFKDYVNDTLVPIMEIIMDSEDEEYRMQHASSRE